MKGFVSTPYSITRLSEIISAKYLIWQLVKRDFTVRYKQTALGFIWAVINPLVSILLYFLYLVFWLSYQHLNIRLLMLQF